MIESIAPGQGEKLQDILFPCETDIIPIDLENLYTQFNKTTSFNEKLAILSLVSFKSHSKADIMRIFNCSECFGGLLGAQIPDV